VARSSVGDSSIVYGCAPYMCRTEAKVQARNSSGIFVTIHRAAM